MQYVFDGRKSLRDGFTLMELLIAMTILAILAGVSVPILMTQLEKAKVSGTRGNLRTVKAAIDTFKIDTGKYPSKLRDLVKKPSDEGIARRWQKGGYIQGGELPEDGWYEPFQYKKTSQGKNPYELYSYGPDGPGSEKSEWLSVWDRR